MKRSRTGWSKTLLWAGVLAGSFGYALPAPAAAKNVLVVTVTKGFRHSSIPTAERVLAQLGQKSGAFTVDYARVDPNDARFKGPNGKPDGARVEAAIKQVLAEKMSPAALSNYDAVVFANTTGELPLPDKSAFLNWIKSGKGFVGMHSATDTLHEFTPYLEMVGGEFLGHGAQVEVEVVNEDAGCPACRHLPPHWKVFEEIYLFQRFDRSRVHGLLRLDKDPNSGAPGDFPISWCRNYGKGRVFYTSLGHREDIWDAQTPADYHRNNSVEVAEAYQAHILNGIRWVLGLEEWDVRRRSKAPK